ncbi:MAG: hypothetical protein EBT47_12840 [Chloroflexi bacterium]|nr:hypothetical protein [Chloroflexota bacterium]
MELGLGQDAAAGTMVVAVMTDGVRDGQSGQVRDFARGLRLVLVAGDVNAFRGYLGQWDDILGDTTELSGQSDADVRGFARGGGFRCNPERRKRWLPGH